MTLGELIEVVAALPPDAVVGIGEPASYRGTYAELAFARVNGATAGALLAEARACVGQTFEGYKGGEYTMDTWTDCHVAEWGCTGDALTREFFDLVRAKHELHGLIRDLVALHGADAVRDSVVAAASGFEVAR